MLHYLCFLKVFEWLNGENIGFLLHVSVRLSTLYYLSALLMQVADAVLRDYIFVHLDDNVDKFNLLMLVITFYLVSKMFIYLILSCLLCLFL